MYIWIIRQKALSEQTLSDQLSVDTAVECQTLVALCNAAQFQQRVLEFIVDNIAEVPKTDHWEHMVQRYSLSYVSQKDTQNVKHDDEQHHQ